MSKIEKFRKRWYKEVGVLNTILYALSIYSIFHFLYYEASLLYLLFPFILALYVDIMVNFRYLNEKLKRRK